MRGLTSGWPETTRDTVDMATPARSATCRMLGLRLVLSVSSLSCRTAQYSYLHDDRESTENLRRGLRHLCRRGMRIAFRRRAPVGARCLTSDPRCGTKR